VIDLDDCYVTVRADLVPPLVRRSWKVNFPGLFIAMATLAPLWYTETACAHHILSTDNTSSNGIPHMQHLGHVFESTTRQRCNDGYGVTCGPLIARHTANHASQLSRFCAILAFLDGRENDCVSQIILKPWPTALIQTFEDSPDDTDNLSSVLDSWPWTPRLSFF
jgi:hypothetical protein